jgi:type I restriction enzyme, S subunit
LEGLEVSVLRKSEALLDNATLRVDPEYFIKDAVRAYHLLSGQTRFGTMIESGYRVVYENTKVVEREEGIEADLPFFLQSADITTPFINEGTLSCVPDSDWDRYPKGRIIPGELLVEVKGKAEKVAIVPDDFPARTLVTGTCFKISPISPSHRSLMLAYLMSDHGAVLKNRLKTNLLVSYIAKDDLYRLPFPIISDALRFAIHEKVQAALDCRKEILGKTAEAEATLLAALGLAGWSPPEPLSYTARAADALTAARLDAQFYAPRIRALLDVLGRDGRTLSDIAKPRRDRFSAKKCDAFHYIEIGDVEGGGGLGSTLLDSADAPSRATWHVRTGDVLTSTVRPIRRLSAIVAPQQDRYVASSGFAVLQPTAVTPEVLMTFLRLPVICELMDLYGSASMYPAISESDILGLPVPMVTDEVADSVTAAVQSAFAARARSRALLSSAKRAVEIAIEQGEDAALAYLSE